MNRKALADTIGEISHALRGLSDIGTEGFDCSERTLATIAAWGHAGRPFAETLRSIRSDLGDCRRCRLSKSRTHIVFGEGDPQADLLFVGEGPGFDEDRQGVPFVGAAGQLLTKIIRAIRLNRSQVYICNIVKCRPPKNRNPQPDEADACFPFLERQIASVRPLVICALGSVAARTLLKTDAPISRLRGRFHDYRGIKVMPTYHPAYLLRNPEKKREVWEDMKRMIRELGPDRTP